MCDVLCKLCLLIIAFICPPLAVGLHMGCNNDFCINLLLTLLLWLPGMIHAFFVIIMKEPLTTYTTRVVHVYH
ncbi:hypothetical protein PRIPAC_70537 [Pristionchus pacificus]|uniref:Uncharacterized protein n=1 Tax=Pristionchus pacificus TaxID=54126 RepID=A0A2A6C865_PRIPA|nr:hypothetical protein PRIPAC_70537 [Pristionchus pacificus]|eukprot:PDM74297.1 hypothetical protein PRIPAC_41653 [Pristionchus pacificus]